MNEKNIEKVQFQLAEKYHNDYEQLCKILAILIESGFDSINYPIHMIQEQWDMRMTFPIANDGAQGIRLTRWRNGGLTVSFTNGFEDVKNPRRVEITKKLREQGFDVV